MRLLKTEPLPKFPSDLLFSCEFEFSVFQSLWHIFKLFFWSVYRLILPSIFAPEIRLIFSPFFRRIFTLFLMYFFNAFLMHFFNAFSMLFRCIFSMLFWYFFKRFSRDPKGRFFWSFFTGKHTVYIEFFTEAK